MDLTNKVLSVFTHDKSKIGIHPLRVKVELKDYGTALAVERIFNVEILDLNFRASYLPEMKYLIGSNFEYF